MILTSALWLGPAFAGAGLLLALLAVEWLGVRLHRQASHLTSGWFYLSALLELLAAVAVLLGGLSTGVWQPGEAGLLAPDWGMVAEWLPGYAAGMALWLTLVFYAGWRREAATAPGPRQGVIAQAARLARDETLLAIWRAALAPALGLYWAAWAAAGLRLATRWWLPAGALARRRGERANLLLPGALDVAATVVIIMTGSAWLALATRAMIYAVSSMARALCQRAARRAARRGEASELGAETEV